MMYFQSQHGEKPLSRLPIYFSYQSGFFISLYLQPSSPIPPFFFLYVQKQEATVLSVAFCKERSTKKGVDDLEGERW